MLDGTAKNVAAYAGMAVSLVAGSRIARKPRIKAFLSTPPALWFLFLFHGGVAAVCCFMRDGTKGIMVGAGVGLVSLGAAGGLVANRRTRVAAVGRHWA